MSELVFDHVFCDRLKDVSLRMSDGLQVLLADESDGSGVLIELCAGVRAPRRGRVSLDGENPSTSPRCRRRIASLLPVEPPIASGGDVRGWLAELGPLRRMAPEAVLGASGVAGDRLVRSLAGAERRMLACWLALAQDDATLVALHDPLSACSAEQRERLLERIGELARSTIVLVTTPSIAHARLLGGTCERLDRGLLAPAASSAGARSAWHGLPGACLTIEADTPRALLAALASEPGVRELRYDEPSGRLIARAEDLERLARDVARAIVSTGVEVRSLRVGADDLDALRAAASAMDDAAGAAYRATRAQQRGAQSSTPVLGTAPSAQVAAAPANPGAPQGAVVSQGAAASPESPRRMPDGSA